MIAANLHYRRSVTDGCFLMRNGSRSGTERVARARSSGGDGEMCGFVSTPTIPQDPAASSCSRPRLGCVRQVPRRRQARRGANSVRGHRNARPWHRQSTPRKVSVSIKIKSELLFFLFVSPFYPCSFFFPFRYLCLVLCFSFLISLFRSFFLS